MQRRSFVMAGLDPAISLSGNAVPFLSGITGTSPVMTSCGQASSPVFFAAPGRPSSLPRFAGPCSLPRSKSRGGWRAEAARIVACRIHVPFRHVAPLGAPSRRSSIRRRAALSDVPFRLAFGSDVATPSGPAAPFEPRASLNGPPSASSSRAAPSARRAGSRRRPGAWRSVRHPRPRAPHPIPPSSTPHESALGGSDCGGL